MDRKSSLGSSFLFVGYIIVIVKLIYKIYLLKYGGIILARRSKTSMPKAIYVSNDGETIREIDPTEALQIKEQALMGYTLYCENYFKSDCRAQVKVVRLGYFNLMPDREGREYHCPDCFYHIDTVPITERIRNIPKNKKAVLAIDNSDIFEGIITSDKANQLRKKNNANNQAKKIPEKIITRTVAGTQNTYIRTIGDLIELLNSKDNVMINQALNQLYNSNTFYKRDAYEMLWNQRPEHTLIVEGYLDQRDLNLIEKKGYTYVYSDYQRNNNDIRIMLVYQGKGKKRFQNTVANLIQWIDKESNGSRKLALVKGIIVKYYEESKIIVLQVKDIDIKYRKYQYSVENGKPKAEKIKKIQQPQEVYKAPPIKESSKLEVIPESKQILDVKTDEFLLQYVDKSYLQNMKQLNIPPLPLKKWFYIEKKDTLSFVPMNKFKGVENSNRQDGTWLNQLYHLKHVSQNLQILQNSSFENFKKSLLQTSDMQFNYYEPLDSYYVDKGGTYRSVLAKVLNVENVIGKVNIYKSNGKLENEQRLFKKQLSNLESIIYELGFTSVYSDDKQTMTIYTRDNQIITAFKNVVYPTFYREGNNSFTYLISVFQELREEILTLKRKPTFLRKGIMFMKRKIQKECHEEYYYKMLNLSLLTK